ncbi:MAG: endonuclease/exonuclease/phosphatase family protein [Pigmentiphaga sp.]|nr:endonuclease/exonuclease/phosphatase family protein [Pigmentiphaga sp.]
MSIIRVVSYNIHKGVSALGIHESVQTLRLGLHNLRADLVFLQEVQGRNDRAASLHAQHEMIGAALRLESAYGKNAVREFTDHGNALLSRYPILRSQNLDISDHKLEQRGLLHTVVGIGDHEVHCFVVHLGLFAGSRDRQLEALVKRIDEIVPAHCPVLIAGDFNDWTNVLSQKLVERLGLYEVFASAPQRRGAELPSLSESVRLLRQAIQAGDFSVLRNVENRHGVSPLLGMGAATAPRPPRTFPSFFPFLRLDRIYQRGFSVRKASVLHGKPWVRLSDHSPILCELELP